MDVSTRIKPAFARNTFLLRLIFALVGLVASTAAHASSVTVSASTGFYNTPATSSQSGTFTATFDALPSLSPSNALIALSKGTQTAVGTRPLDGWLGTIGGAGLPANHFSIEFYSGCAHEGDTFYPPAIPDGAALKDSLQLLVNDHYSRPVLGRIKLKNGKFGYVDTGKRQKIGISTIVKGSDAIESVVIYAQDDADAKWAIVKATANNYPYAEHAWGQRLKNWPNSEYGYLWVNGIWNNSNTFIRVLANSIGRKADVTTGFHPGNDTPVPVQDNGPVPQPD